MTCRRCGSAVVPGAGMCAVCGEPVRAGWFNSASVRSADGRLPAALDAPDLYAGFWRRVAAYALDSLLLAVMSIVAGLVVAIVFRVGMVARGLAGSESSLDAWGSIVGVLIPWLYFARFESSPAQATPGKRALGLQVTDEHGRQIGFWRASVRFFCQIVSALTFCVGCMMAGWTHRNQTLHDMLAGCCVVRRQGLDRIERQKSLRAGVRGHAMPRWAIALITASVSLFVAGAVVSGIGIPGLQAYVVRMQLGEGVQLAGDVMERTAGYYANTGKFPESNAEASLANPPGISGEYVSGVHVGMTRASRGVVLVTFSDQDPQHASETLAGKYLAFVAQPRSDRSMAWECVSTLRKLYLGRTCRHVEDDD